MSSMFTWVDFAEDDRGMFVGRASCNTNDPLVSWICRAIIEAACIGRGRAQLQAVTDTITDSQWGRECRIY